MTISWNEVTILWNEVTIFWNEVTVRWNEVTWNEVTMERSDRIPFLPTRNLRSPILPFSANLLDSLKYKTLENSKLYV